MLERESTEIFVAAVERRMERALSGPEGGQGAVLAEASRHLCLGAGGKRFRPRLVLLLGRAAGADLAALEDLAVVAEFIHGASLLHDDVVDEGQQRRGRPTVNASWGNQVAVLAGDWLLSEAFGLLKPHPRAVTTEAIEVVGEMSRAAVAEVESRGRVDLPLQSWRAIAEGKTGALFAWCGRAAARVAGREELVEVFGRFGRRLGIAFQLGDDLKDLHGGEAGKDRFSDVRNANPSFPLLLAAERSAALKEQLAKAWGAPPLGRDLAEQLGRAVIACGADVDAALALKQEVAEAVSALGPFGKTRWCAELLQAAVGFAADPSAALPGELAARARAQGTG